MPLTALGMPFQPVLQSYILLNISKLALCMVSHLHCGDSTRAQHARYRRLPSRVSATRCDTPAGALTVATCASGTGSVYRAAITPGRCKPSAFTRGVYK